MIAEAAVRAMVHIRLPIMGILIVVLYCSSIQVPVMHNATLNAVMWLNNVEDVPSCQR
jgi:hypothetical protein